ncbi:BZ3500_MvSof-1268-A1-R1_Chr7-2g09527 [Microbotryum saponariae]|uniref:BZ3500_MvSof-1268-A1-R1_Chr7-2g09527 protein n=1 Tax=Microbotryum saponariae TaxID=289078 RepID=A0A2X0N434_9BASI|nr:BZ3501_MvSof-1269-A2-R1_Chr7-1g09227 [Microbotryum saponariae]SDA02636.1 BZ3500_MvSof-1268-A1-R1_Chr7-2g09527 [Microbotryum saponariae]
MSLWRKPGTRTFQLVHRSQRDPLINDPEASDRVLKEVGAKQRPKGNAPGPPASDLELTFDRAPRPIEADDDAGDAAAYGVYFDDTKYDYMQHLRRVGDVGESYLVEAPSKKGKRPVGNKNVRSSEGVVVKDSPSAELELPEEALPSHPLDEVSYVDATTSRTETKGLQPDLDPNIREVLEALDDDDYALDAEGDSEDEDDFFGSIVQGGEVIDSHGWHRANLDEESRPDRKEGDPLARGMRELALTTQGDGNDKVDDSLEARVARFKATSANAPSSELSDEDGFSEGGDTIAELKAGSARRPPRRGASAARSQFSMSSSAMFRNQGLQTLDERFDQVRIGYQKPIEKLYEDDSDDESWGEDSDGPGEDDNAQPRAIPFGQPREDLDQILEEFLSRYEILGGKMRHRAEGDDGDLGHMGELDRLRSELASLDIAGSSAATDPVTVARQLEKDSILAAVERQRKEARARKGNESIDIDKRPKERWDCETVLSTYSNISNHPRLLRVKGGPTSRASRIRLDEKTGFPIVGSAVRAGLKAGSGETIGDAEDEDEGDDEAPRVETIKRPRDETAEDKRARKGAVKEQRSARRAEKKSTKDEFSQEMTRQKRVAGRAVADGAAADVRVGQGARRLA